MGLHIAKKGQIFRNRNLRNVCREKTKNIDHISTKNTKLLINKINK